MRRAALFASLAIAACQVRVTECGDKEGKVVHISERTPPIYTCPENYEQRSTGHETICLKSVESLPIETCLHGELHDGVCVTHEQIIQTCPHGFQPTSEKKKTLHSLLCAQISVLPPEPRCINGDYNGGGCQIERIASVVRVCPTARMKHTSGCYEWVSVPKILKCKPGFELQGNTCVGEELQPCAIEDNWCADGNDCGKKKLRSFRKKQLPQKAGLCEVHAQTAPFEICPPEAHEPIKGSGCLILSEKELQPYCPIQRGIMDEDGRICRGIFHEDPIFDCPHSYTPCEKQPSHGAAKCCRIEYAEPISICRNGTEETNGRCIGTSQAELICEEGLTLDGDICKGFQVTPPKLRYSITVETTGKHHRTK